MPQSVVIRPGVARWTLHGPDCRPPAKDWRRADGLDRARWWQTLARWARLAMVGQLLEGEGRDGKYMQQPRPISRKWYRDRGLEWRGPTISPQRANSRFVRELIVAAKGDRVIGTWPLPTARIASWHARGLAGRGRPYFDDAGRIVGWRGIKGAVTGIVRDFVGLNRKRLAWAMEKAREEWTATLPDPAPAPPAPPKPEIKLVTTRPPAPPRPPKVTIPNRPATPPPPPNRRPSTAGELVERYPFLEKYRPTDRPVVLAPRTPPPAAAPPRPGAASRAAATIGGLFRRLFGR